MNPYQSVLFHESGKRDSRWFKDFSESHFGFGEKTNFSELGFGNYEGEIVNNLPNGKGTFT